MEKGFSFTFPQAILKKKKKKKGRENLGMTRILSNLIHVISVYASWDSSFFFKLTWHFLSMFIYVEKRRSKDFIIHAKMEH